MEASEVVAEATKEHSFFSMLSAELWKIQRHPFVRVGGMEVARVEIPKAEKSAQLSYDPSRVFKPEEGEGGPIRQDPEYVEFERQEFENEMEVHNQLLTKAIQKKHNSRLAKASEDDLSHSKPFNPFSFDRGRCTRCDRCQQFQGNFTLDQQANIDVFECKDCRCPMNSHPAIVSDRTFSKLLYGHMLNRDLKECHLRANAFVAALALPKAQGDPHTHNKRLLQLLSEGGYSAMSSLFLEPWQFLHRLAEQKLFDRLDRCIDKYSFDEYFHFFQVMYRLPMDPLSLDFRNEADSIKLKLQLYTTLREQLHKKYRSLSQSSRVYCLLLRGSESCNPAHFRKFTKAIGELMHPYTLFYSSDNLYDSCVDTQLFFPSYLEVNYETVLLANRNDGSMKLASDKLRDVLDYNNFVVVEEEFERIKRTKLESAFRFDRNAYLLNYLLGQQVVSEVVPEFVMKIVGKIGPPHFTNPCRHLDNVIRVRQPLQNQQLQKQLCPEMLCSQRCALVLRPVLVKSGMDELILNYFRQNHFTLISRVFVKLEKVQAVFFALLQNIREQEREEYLEMMQSGLLEIVLVSKRSAIIEANLLNEGARFGFKHNGVRLIKSAPSIVVTINGKTYREEVPISYSNPLLSSNNSQVFNGVKTLFDLQSIILGERRQEPPIVLDSATGELIRQEGEPFGRNNIGPRIASAITEELNRDTFNYWMYTSTSETITEQIVSQFMPECQQFEWICVFIKPGFVHLNKLIRSHLELLRYKVVEAKTVLLSKSLAASLVESLLVLRLDKEARQAISLKWYNEKVEVLCLAKPGGRREMLSFLTGFTLGDPTTTVNLDEPLNDAKLKELLVPVWTSEQLALQVLSPVLYSIESSIRNIAVLGPQEQFALLNFLCGSIFGVGIEAAPLKTSIGELSYYLASDQEKARLQSWYYATVSEKHPHSVPLMFQYRRYGAAVFCLQSHCGQQFVQHVLDDFLKENLHPDDRKKRSSLALYLWAKKLAQLVSDVSQIRSELEGYGEISRYANIYRGAATDEYFVQSEIKRVNKLAEHASVAVHKDIVRTLKRLPTLRGFLDRGKKANKRLLPSLQEDSLRVIKTSQLTKLHMLDQFELIDPNHELSDSRNMSVVALYNVQPHLLPKYSLFSRIYVDLLKYSCLSKDYQAPLTELFTLFVELTQRTATMDFEMLGVEIYILLAQAFVSDEKWALPFLLEGLPVLSGKLGKLNEAAQTNLEGKKRKFIEKKQYYSNREVIAQPQRVMEPLQDKYIINVYDDKKPQKGVLFDPADPLHNRWATETRMVNLVREVDSQKEPRHGVNVEYEKKISENEELVRAQVNKQVQKYVEYNQEEFLYETGIERHVWYRRVKGEEKQELQSHIKQTQLKPSAKLDKALDKQVQMFLSFKQKQEGSGDQT